MRKPFTLLAALVFLVVAIGQATRAYFGFDVVIDGHPIPVAASWIAAGVAAFLSVMLFMEARR